MKKKAISQRTLPLLCLIILLSGCTQQIPKKTYFTGSNLRPSHFQQDALLASNYEYLLQPGDRLRMEFVQQEDLSRDILIRPDGWITTPLVSDTRAGGMTLNQLRTSMLEKYNKVLREPTMSIILTDSQPQFIYVGGEVNNGGMMLPYWPRLTAQQAIIAAGGVSPEGEMRNVFIVRDSGISRPQYMLSVLWNTNNQQFNDFYLQPKDIVYVPSSAIADANQFVEQYINKLIPFSKNMNATYTYGSFEP